MAYTSGTGPVNAGVAGSGADNQYTEEERRQISEQRRLQLQEESGGPSGPGLGFHGYGADEGVEKLYRVFGKYWTFGRNDVDVRSRDQ
ncbi:hypothetical protein MMC08_004519 [Hypocenomyce scalaris]|nr:hypothetical protein [Hypocenomyce scalaris]